MILMVIMVIIVINGDKKYDDDHNIDINNDINMATGLNDRISWRSMAHDGVETMKLIDKKKKMQGMRNEKLLKL